MFALVLAVSVAAPHGVAAGSADAPAAVESMRAIFLREVPESLAVTAAEDATVRALFLAAVAPLGASHLSAQFYLVVDRNRARQRAYLLFGSGPDAWSLVGAAPVSTGRGGAYEYFLTPLGVFDHSLANPDFRSEGTPNDNGIRGYGERGLRVFDFGWVLAERAWGRGGHSLMRLQMHATDEVQLAPKLGTAASKGCIRIPASLNRLIDRYGLLDASYEAALRAGADLWVLRTDRAPTGYSGRYLVIVDSSQRVAGPEVSARLDRSLGNGTC